MSNPRKPWTDSSGRSLSDYPRPSVAVDTAVLTVPVGSDSPRARRGGVTRGLSGLHVLLVRSHRPSGRPFWGLPGTFVHEGETLRRAALRALETKAGIHGLDPSQLFVFDDPRRDPRGWVMSVGHLDVVRWELVGNGVDDREGAELVPVEPILSGDRSLPYDHDAIVRFAVDQLRAEYAEAPDPRGLLAERFTLRELEVLHRAIDPEGTPAKDTFRRGVEPLLVDTGEMTSGTVGKPARLFRRR